MLNSTGLPDPPPVAAGVYEPPVTAGDGGVDVKLIDCGACACGDWKMNA